MKVLLIDDQKDLHEVLEYVFARKGFEVCSVYNLADATKLLKNQKFTAVVCDQFLPDGRGLDWFNLHEGQLLDTELVLFTGCLDELDAGRAQVILKTDVTKLSDFLSRMVKTQRRAAG